MSSDEVEFWERDAGLELCVQRVPKGPSASVNNDEGMEGVSSNHARTFRTLPTARRCEITKRVRTLAAETVIMYARKLAALCTDDGHKYQNGEQESHGGIFGRSSPNKVR